MSRISARAAVPVRGDRTVGGDRHARRTALAHARVDEPCRTATCGALSNIAARSCMSPSSPCVARPSSQTRPSAAVRRRKQRREPVLRHRLVAIGRDGRRPACGRRPTTRAQIVGLRIGSVLLHPVRGERAVRHRAHGRHVRRVDHQVLARRRPRAASDQPVAVRSANFSADFFPDRSIQLRTTRSPSTVICGTELSAPAGDASGSTTSGRPAAVIAPRTDATAAAETQRDDPDAATRALAPARRHYVRSRSGTPVLDRALDLIGRQLLAIGLLDERRQLRVGREPERDDLRLLEPARGSPAAPASAATRTAPHLELDDAILQRRGVHAADDAAA